MVLNSVALSCDVQRIVLQEGVEETSIRMMRLLWSSGNCRSSRARTILNPKSLAGAQITTTGKSIKRISEVSKHVGVTLSWVSHYLEG